MFSASECLFAPGGHVFTKVTTGVGFMSVKEALLLDTVMIKGHSSDIKRRTGWLRRTGRGQRERKK